MSDKPRQDTSCPICGCKETEIILADGAFMLRCPGCLSDTAGWPRIDANAMINRQAKLTPSPEASRPVAMVVQADRDGSISKEIAPTAWSTYELELKKLKAHPWVQEGAAKIVPLYLHPQVTPSPDVAKLVRQGELVAQGLEIDFSVSAEWVRKLNNALLSLSAQLKEKEAKCARLREDAERYRFLAECDLFGIHYEYGEAQRWLDSRTELDAAIDSAKESK